MTGGMAPVWTGILFRREVLEMVGFPDPETLGPFDLEFCLRLAAKFPYVVEKHPSAVFTLNRASFSATQPMSSFWPGWKRMLHKFETDGGMDEAFRREALAALQRDARRMLFRRGANALAASRMDFARAAAKALEEDCGMYGRARLLRTITNGCEHSSLLQHAYTFAYRVAEARIVRSRNVMQAKYGGLLRAA